MEKTVGAGYNETPFMMFRATKMGVAICFALLHCGCGAEDDYGRANELHWHVWPGMEEPTADEVDAVSEIFGLELLRSDSNVQAVTVYFSDEVGEVGNFGSAFSCTPHILVTDRSAKVMAHEFGHAYGLSHVDDPENLMDLLGGTELRDEQIDEVRRNAQIIEDECSIE